MPRAKKNNNQKVNAFFDRVSQRLKFLTESHVAPGDLVGLISVESLQEIYAYILRNQSVLKRDLNKGQPCRLGKEKTNLNRTLNLIFDPRSDEIMLILETKSKDQVNVSKRLNSEVFSGTFKTTKVAWRIDEVNPEKFANSVFYATKKDNFSKEKWEVEVPQKAIQYMGKSPCLTLTSLGKVIDKPGIRPSNQTHYDKKRSFYSRWADKGMLSSFLKTAEGETLRPEQLHKMAMQLLTAVKAMHDAGAIHQDIKPDNILVFSDPVEGGYRLELADFGMTFLDSEKRPYNYEAISTRQYESPEIAAIKKDPKSFMHEYYYDKAFPSYGKELGELLDPKPEYLYPHKSNDMWAIGIVLHQLHHNTKLPSVLIEGLLKVNREERLTAEQACILLQNPPAPLIFEERPKRKALEKAEPEAEPELVAEQNSPKRRKSDGGCLRRFFG